MAEKDEKTIKEDELRAKITADVTAKMEAEAKEKAEAESKVKAETEANEKAEHEKIEAEVRDQLKKQQIPAGEDKKDDTDSKPGNKRHSRKMDDQSEQIYDALKSDKIGEFEFDMQVDETEERLELAKSAIINGTKANIDGASGYGPEFVPEEWAPGFYFRLGSLHGNLMNLFPKYGMTTDVKNIAEILTKPTISAYSSYQNQNTAIENVSATDITTANATLTARRFVAKLNVYETVLQDEKFGLMRGIRRAMSEEVSASISSAILNGDTTATHMDEDYEALGANIPEAMWKGLRKLTMAGSLGTDGDSTYTLANLDTVQGTMGKYAVGENLMKSKWIMGIKTYRQLMGLWRASTTTPVAADFVLKNGHIQSYMGHDIIISDKQREDLEVDGYHDESGVSASEGFMCLVNVANFIIGLRNNISIKVVPDPLNDRKQVQATLRMDFQPFETPSASIPIISGMYGYTL